MSQAIEKGMSSTPLINAATDALMINTRMNIRAYNYIVGDGWEGDIVRGGGEG